MKYDPKKHHHHSIRLHGYDYSQNGAYYITICTEKRQCLFGEIINKQMVLNEQGNMIKSIWNELPKRYNNTVLDSFAIMPDHIHAIIFIVGASLVGAQNNNAKKAAPTRDAPTNRIAIGNIIGGFKSITTNAYIDGVKNDGWMPFNKKLWQRNFYEHIVRNNNDLNRIREYIFNNQ